MTRPMLAVLCALFFVVPAPARAGQASPSVQVGAFQVKADGRVGSHAVYSGDAAGKTFEGVSRVGECRLIAGTWNESDPDLPALLDAWEIRGMVLDLGRDTATVRLEWRRIRSRGTAVSETFQSRELVLRQDELVRLDTPHSSAQCPGAENDEVVFAARFASSGAPQTVNRGPQRNGIAAASTTRSAMPTYDAELWLIRSAPGQPESVIPLTVRVTAGSGTYRFSPMQVAVRNGRMTLQVDGSLHIAGPEGRPAMFMIQVNRAITFTPANQPSRDPAVIPDDPGSRMSAGRALPGPSDVSEFRMYAVTLPGGAPLPDTFSVRVRLRPAAVP